MRLEVYLNARGERRFVGLLEERGGDILFEYDKRFLDSGIELSPFLLPLRPGVASVSYTHLDVYKRQPRNRATGTRLASP